ncbi:MAG TPA: hypothetical protein VEP90_08290, partial [Methylomirabilota bacterium]|nr:hypothetical protein [Methylomirabilota bacterium]
GDSFQLRDDFDQKTKDILSRRAGAKCSNPICGQETSGPHTDEKKAINVGVAAHITAASEGGPRYDPTLSQEERISPDNGIWLCQVCAKLIDSDAKRYTVDLIKGWKRDAENEARSRVEGRHRTRQNNKLAVFSKLKKLMPRLLGEMQQDLLQYPLRREFVLLQRSWTYNGAGHELCYFYDDYNDLEGMISILCNYNLVRDITFNNVKRYLFLEELVDYLTQSRTEV